MVMMLLMQTQTHRDTIRHRDDDDDAWQQRRRVLSGFFGACVCMSLSHSMDDDSL